MHNNNYNNNNNNNNYNNRRIFLIRINYLNKNHKQQSVIKNMMQEINNYNRQKKKQTKSILMKLIKEVQIINHQLSTNMMMIQDLLRKL